MGRAYLLNCIKYCHSFAHLAKEPFSFSKVFPIIKLNCGNYKYVNLLNKNVKENLSWRSLQLKGPALFFNTLQGMIFGTLLLMSVQVVSAASASAKFLIEEADRLYDKLQFEDIYNLLIGEKNLRNPDILWRLARSIYEKARQTQENDKKKELYRQALEYLQEAQSLDNNNFAVHKWNAILKDCYFSLEGTKARISHLYEIKTHMEKACELNPKDGTSWHILGMWHFGIANISWYERKAASLFFATPPESTYKDALEIFLKAEAVEPHFYSKNILMIAQCLFYSGKKDEAKTYFLEAKDFPGETLDDQEVRQEAEKWLRNL